MRRAFLVLCCAAALVEAGAPQTKSVTWTGWFSDLECASGRAASGTFTATNPECAKTCLKKGVAPAFISEQAKAVFTVKGYPGVVEQLGFHVEVQATVDEAARTVTIQKVKQLGYDGASCERPKH